MDAENSVIDRNTVEGERAYSLVLEYLMDQQLAPILDILKADLQQQIIQTDINSMTRIEPVREKIDTLLRRFNTWATHGIDDEIMRLNKRIDLLVERLPPVDQDDIESRLRGWELHGRPL